MTDEEITQEALKYGYSLYNETQESTDEYYGKWYGKGPSASVPPSFFVEISTERGLVGKTFYINEELEKGMGIDEILEKHRDIYLSLTSIDFEEHMPPEQNIDVHRATFFHKDDYVGQIQLNIKDGVVRAQYGLGIRIKY